MDRRGFLSSVPACSLFLFCSWECGGGPRGPRTARQAGAPGGEAVAFRSSAGAPGGPEPGSVGAAALDGARGLHGGLGPCGRLRLPPGPLLAQDSPAALGRGDWAGRGRGAVPLL